MEDDDLLGVMLDFGDDGENTVAPAPAAQLPPPLAAGVPPGLPPGASMAAASPTPAASTVSASSVPSVGPHVAQNNPQAVHMAHQQFQGYHRMAQLLAAKHPERRNVVETQLSKTKAIGALPGRTPHEKLQGATAVLRNGLKQAFTPEEYEWAKMQARTAGPAATASPVQAAPGAPQQHSALQQQQAAAAQMQQRQAGVPAGMQQQQAAQQQAQQRAGAQSAARGPSPMPRNPSPAPAAAASAGVGGQPMLTAQQVIQAQQQQQQMIMQQAYAAQAAAAAAAAAHAAKRPADGGGEPAAKRAKGGAAAGAGKKKDMDDTGITLDNLYDWDQETNQLMEGLQRDRDAQRVKPKTSSNQQFLSEWRVGHEFYRQIQRTGGGLRVKGECFELVQLAFQAHMTQLIQRSLRSAGHRQDACRRSADCAVTSDPRRGVTQIERREKAKADERAEAERAKLLQEAKSKRADEETKERAQKAKAELVGKQQASLANAAVAATLGGKSKGKVNKWDKWSTAAAAGPAAGGEASGAAGGKGKKAGGKKGGGKKGAAAADSEGGSEGGAAAGSDVSGAAAADGKAKAALPRMGLTGAASVGSDDASTIHIKDVLGCLERDPLYAKGGLLYRLYNTPHASAAQG